jgi:3-oxoacyl-[acyl-carrier protein] reductase
MDLELGGKVAMVAAASKGMGRACARGFAREGARVSMCSRSAADVERAGAEIREESGAEVLAMAADVTRPEAIQAWVDRTIQQFGGVDILVTNSGGPPRGGWDDFQSDEPWVKAFELNLLSTIRMIRAVVPSMRQRGGGRILNIQSSSVKAPISGLILSNTVRPGVQGLAKTLSQELAADNILINSVLPGRIYTDRLRSGILHQVETRGISEEEAARESAKDIPLKRFGTPEEFADMVVFLASARASYITGSAIAVDGGVIQSLW